jgi:hypothetical protein
MKELVCSKGFLISKDDEGNYVPFFVRTRSQDIIWNDTSNSKIMQALIDIGESTGVEETSHKIKLNIKEWNVSLDSDKHVTYTRKINVVTDYLFGISEDDNTDFYATVLLPAPLACDSELNIQVTKAVGCDQLAYAALNTVPIYDINGNIEAVEIHFKNFTYTFPSNFMDLPCFLKSFVFVNISGTCMELSGDHTFVNLMNNTVFYNLNKSSLDIGDVEINDKLYFELTDDGFIERNPILTDIDTIKDVYIDLNRNELYETLDDVKDIGRTNIGNMFDTKTNKFYRDYRESVNTINFNPTSDSSHYNIETNIPFVYEDTEGDKESFNYFDLKTNRKFNSPNDL